MINKLKKKIFWIIEIPLSILILVVLSLFITLNYRNTITSSVMFMDRINNIDEIISERPDFNIEGTYRFELNSNNLIIRESNQATNELRELATKISKENNDSEGYDGKYIYKIKKFGVNGKEVILMENEEVINNLKITTTIAVIIGIASLLGVYVIAKKISKIIVKPVEETFEKQKQFISDASHELKTPLAVIEANADVLQSKVGDDKWLAYIQNEVQSMNKLVNDLLVLSKMENNNNTNIQKFDISKEIQMAVSVFESMMYEKNIKLVSNIEEGIIFNGDKDDIKHIVSIILDNAIKHTNKKGKIIVNTQKEKNGIMLEIKNQGDPIPDEDIEKIFERFYRVDKARNRNEKRYGLGLAIAKELVGKYKGEIKASSKDGYTSFIVKLNNK